MRVWKFLVPADTFYPLPSNPNRSYKGCIAVAVAETEEDARNVLASEGDDVAWLEIARVKSFDPSKPAFVALSMF